MFTSKSQSQSSRPTSGNRRPPRRDDRRGGGGERVEKQYEEKLLDLSRVTRVTAGGKRFSFRATMAIGDQKGKVGVGVAKGRDVAQAIAKAKSVAEKSMITLALNGRRTIPHEVKAKYCAATVLLRPASVGHGLVVGGAARVICNLAGISDISAKVLGNTSNKLSNAHATILALKKLRAVKINAPKGEKIKEAKENKKEESPVEVKEKK